MEFSKKDVATELRLRCPCTGLPVSRTGSASLTPNRTSAISSGWWSLNSLGGWRPSNQSALGRAHETTCCCGAAIIRTSSHPPPSPSRHCALRLHLWRS